MLGRTTLIAVALMSCTTIPIAYAAGPAGVAELLGQADFWRSKNRGDLANQAYQRVLAIDPGNAVARARLGGGGSPAPVAAKKAPAPAPLRAAPAPRATTIVTAAPAPAPKRAPVQTRADAAGPLRAAGFKALQADRIDQAANLFGQALKRNPGDADALGGLGLARLRANRFAEARDLLAKASAKGSRAQWADALASATFFASLRAAEAARDAGKLPEAEARARELAGSNYKDAKLAVTLLGDVLAREGRYAEAAQLYRDVAQVEAGSGGGQQSAQAAAGLQGKAALNQAMQLAASGNPGAAEAQFQQAINNDPADPWMRYEYARFLIGQGRGPGAESIMAPLSSANSAESLYAAALFLSQTGRESSAVALMARIPDSERTVAMKTFQLQQQTIAAIGQAKLLAARGRPGEGLAGLRMIAGYPNLPVATQATLADALLDMGDAGTATQVVQQAMAQAPAEPDAYQGIVRVLVKTGQEQMAAQVIQQVATTTAQSGVGGGGNGAQAVARLNSILAAAQGEKMRLAGQYAAAFDLLQQAYAGAPGDPEILTSLARLYQAGNMNAQAAQVYEMLLRQRPNDVGTLLGMADASAGAGDTNRAKQALTAAMQRAPASPDVYSTAARIARAQGNEGTAVRYMKQARSLYLRQQRQSLGANGGFSGTNPFANMPIAPQQQQPQQPTMNPFALQAQPMAYEGEGYHGRIQWMDGPAAIARGDAATPKTVAWNQPVPGAQPYPVQYQQPQPYQQQAYAAPVYQQQQAYQAPGYQAQGYPAPSYPAPAAYPAPTYPAASYPAPSYAPPQAYQAPAYQQQGYQPQPYPQQGYPQPAYPPQGQPYANQQPGWTAPPMQQQPQYQPAAMPSFGGPRNGTPYGNAAVTDPTLAQMNREIETLSNELGPKVEVSTNIRQRSGEKGLSKLQEIGGTVTLSTGLLGGRISASASPVVLESGKPSGSGLARFGSNPTIEAQSIVAKVPSPLVGAADQRDTGVAFSGAYQRGAIKVDGGVTPIGFDKTHITGGISVAPKIGEHVTVKLFGERRAVTDSVVAYAGTRDPAQQGKFWGAVMKTGGGASFSYDRNGSGVYADGRYDHYDGTNVRDNRSYQVNIGGYLKAYQSARSSFTIGANVNYQSYANNQNYFTFGNGGYFSPKSFVSVSLPMHYQTERGPLSINADFAPGFQSYQQSSAAIYPTDGVAQAALDVLKATNPDVRARFDSLSQTGFGFAAGLQVAYQIGTGTSVGGEARFNTFGQYNELTSRLYLRQTLGGGK